MKYLTLIRHAKSSWDYPELGDFERPLNDRGRRDAPVMARRLQRAGLKPDRLVSSPALRAISTARLFADTLGLPQERIEVHSPLYEARVSDLLKVVQSLSDAAGEVWLFGHNPGISDFAHRLAKVPFEDLPTCACVRFQLNAKLWSEVSLGDGALTLYSYPKQDAD